MDHVLFPTPLDDAVMQVYGIEWATNANAYGIYKKWTNSPSQRAKLLFSEEVKGFQRCVLPSKTVGGR